MKMILNAVQSGMWAGWAMCGLLASAQAQPPRLALVAEAPELFTVADVTTAELTRSGSVALLERNEISRVLKEQALAGGQSANYVKLGQLLGADGLLLFQRLTEATNQTVVARLVAVKPGVVLGMARAAYPVKEVSEFGKSLVARFQPMFPKLLILSREAVPVSVVHLRAAVTSPDSGELERQINALVLLRLMAERDLFVLERQRMESLGWEKSLQGVDETAFWTGSYMLEGNIDRDGFRPGQVSLHLLLVPPNGGPPVTIQAEGKRDKPAELVEKLIPRLLEALNKQSVVPAWNADQEAARFLEQARWAYQWGVYREAQQATEAAWALGLHTHQLANLRIYSYADAHHHTPGPRLDHTNRRISIEVPPPRDSLDMVARAIELYLSQPERRLTKDGEPALDWMGTGLDVLEQTSQVLRRYYFDFRAQVKAEPQLAEVRRLARELAAVLAVQDQKLAELKRKALRPPPTPAQEPARNSRSEAQTTELQNKRKEIDTQIEALRTKRSAIIKKLSGAQTEERNKHLASIQELVQQETELRRQRFPSRPVQPSVPVPRPAPAPAAAESFELPRNRRPTFSPSMPTPASFSELRYQHGCLWLETPHEAIAMYRDFFGLSASTNAAQTPMLKANGWFRELSSPWLVAWNPDDRPTLKALWWSFLDEMLRSPDPAVRLEGSLIRFPLVLGLYPGMGLGYGGTPPPEITAALESETDRVITALWDNRARFLSGELDIYYRQNKVYSYLAPMLRHFSSLESHLPHPLEKGFGDLEARLAKIKAGTEFQPLLNRLRAADSYDERIVSALSGYFRQKAGENREVKESHARDVLPVFQEYQRRIGADLTGISLLSMQALGRQLTELTGLSVDPLPVTFVTNVVADKAGDRTYTTVITTNKAGERRYSYLYAPGKSGSGQAVLTNAPQLTPGQVARSVEPLAVTRCVQVVSPRSIDPKLRANRIKATCMKGGRLWIAIEYMIREEGEDKVVRAIHSFDPERLASEVVVSVPPWIGVTALEVRGEDVFVNCSTNVIRHYNVPTRKTRDYEIPIESQFALALSAIGQRLFVSTQDRILACDLHSGEIRLLASTRRRPALNDLDRLNQLRATPVFPVERGRFGVFGTGVIYLLDEARLEWVETRELGTGLLNPDHQGNHILLTGEPIFGRGYVAFTTDCRSVVPLLVPPGHHGNPALPGQSSALTISLPEKAKWPDPEARLDVNTALICYDGKNLWILSAGGFAPPVPEVENVLWCFDERWEDPLIIPLRIAVKEPAQTWKLFRTSHGLLLLQQGSTLPWVWLVAWTDIHQWVEAHASKERRLPRKESYAVRKLSPEERRFDQNRNGRLETWERAAMEEDRKAMNSVPPPFGPFGPMSPPFGPPVPPTQ